MLVSQPLRELFWEKQGDKKRFKVKAWTEGQHA